MIRFRPCVLMLGLVFCLRAAAQSGYDNQISRGQKAAKDGQYDAAIEVSQTAIKLDASRWEGYLLWGTALMAQEKFEAAVAPLQMALSHAPANVTPRISEMLKTCAAGASSRPGVAKSDFGGAAPYLQTIKRLLEASPFTVTKDDGTKITQHYRVDLDGCRLQIWNKAEGPSAGTGTPNLSHAVIDLSGIGSAFTTETGQAGVTVMGPPGEGWNLPVNSTADEGPLLKAVRLAAMACKAGASSASLEETTAWIQRTLEANSGNRTTPSGVVSDNYKVEANGCQLRVHQQDKGTNPPQPVDNVDEVDLAQVEWAEVPGLVTHDGLVAVSLDGPILRRFGSGGEHRFPWEFLYVRQSAGVQDRLLKAIYHAVTLCSQAEPF